MSSCSFKTFWNFLTSCTKRPNSSSNTITVCESVNCNLLSRHHHPRRSSSFYHKQSSKMGEENRQTENDFELHLLEPRGSLPPPPPPPPGPNSAKKRRARKRKYNTSCAVTPLIVEVKKDFGNNQPPRVLLDYGWAIFLADEYGQDATTPNYINIRNQYDGNIGIAIPYDIYDCILEAMLQLKNKT